MPVSGDSGLFLIPARLWLENLQLRLSISPHSKEQLVRVAPQTGAGGGACVENCDGGEGAREGRGVRERVEGEDPWPMARHPSSDSHALPLPLRYSHSFARRWPRLRYVLYPVPRSGARAPEGARFRGGGTTGIFRQRLGCRAAFRARWVRDAAFWGMRRCGRHWVRGHVSVRGNTQRPSAEEAS